MPVRVKASISSSPKAPEDLVELGRVAGAYGIRGWVRIQAYSADSDTLLKVDTWWLKPPVSKSAEGDVASESLAVSMRAVNVLSVRVHGQALVAQLSHYSDRTQAETLKGWSVWVSRADFLPLETDEYYWVDLVGCCLYGESDGKETLIGEVVGVMDNGAHGVLRVAHASRQADGALQFQHDAKGRLRETLVPFVSAHVHTVDLKNKQLFSNWPAD